MGSARLVDEYAAQALVAFRKLFEELQ